MLNKKITILILTIAVAGAVSGCIKKTEKPAVNNNDQKIIQEQKKEFECGIIKEENGLKTYRNEYWGVEFSFRDEENNFKISQGCKGSIVISEDSKELRHYIYIFFEQNSFKFDQKQYNTLKESLEAGGWNQYQNIAELISIKEIKNNNNLTFIEVIANVSGGRQSSGYSKHGVCYIEYNKNNKNIIRIYNTHVDIANNVIDTFKFID